MGSGKKEATRKERQGKVGDGMGNVKVKGENFYRYVLCCRMLYFIWMHGMLIVAMMKRCQEVKDLEHVQGGKGSTG